MEPRFEPRLPASGVRTFNAHIVEYSNSGFLIVSLCQYPLPSRKFLPLPCMNLQHLLPLCLWISKTHMGIVIIIGHSRSPTHLQPTTHTFLFYFSWPDPRGFRGSQPVGSSTELTLNLSSVQLRSGRPKFNDQLCPYVKLVSQYPWPSVSPSVRQG